MINHSELFSGLKKLLAENPSQHELIKKAVVTFWEENHFLRDHYCDLCDKKLSDEEIKTILPIDFLVTCYKHSKYAKYYQADVIRKQLGLPERKFFIKDFIEAL